jgi:hypothetical protein
MTLTEAQRLAKIANDRVARLSILDDLTNGKPVTLVIGKDNLGSVYVSGYHVVIPQDIVQEIAFNLRVFLSSDPA